MPDAPVNLTVLSAVPGSVSLQFTGSASIDHYDMYRSLNEYEVGEKINLSPIPQTASPYTVGYVDNAVNSNIPPSAPGIYFYKAVAVDALGNISLPSSDVRVSLGYPQDITPKQATIISIEEMGAGS